MNNSALIMNLQTEYHAYIPKILQDGAHDILIPVEPTGRVVMYSTGYRAIVYNNYITIMTMAVSLPLVV